MEGWERSGFLNNLGRPGVTDEDQNDPRSWQRSTNLNNRYFEYFPAHQKEPSDVETSSVKSKEKRKSWQEAMYDFTQNTTFHGIRYITEKHSMSLRRLIWIILILACSGLMSFQIIDRILFYASWPVTVNVAINFNKTIQFPSVAICNQNAFKITEAHRLGYLELLELLYTKGSREYKLQRIKDLDAGDTKFKDLFLRTRHLREDMIVKCEWDSKPCHASHFVQVLTDHGVCYAFASNTSDPLYITDTGTDHGLRLTINVEQYEYMHGPHDSAGLKILLYDPMEEPLVYELGQAVATGTHTYVGVKVIQMKYLTAPYGNCTDDKKLKYYTYSETACKLECMRDFYADKCNCTLLHMAKSASTPICTIGQYHDCILKAKGDILHPGEANERNKDDFNAQTVEPCDCPQPCEVPMYEPNFSYSTTSNFDVDNLLTMVNTTDLLSRYIKARDTAHSVEMKYFKVDKTVIEDCIKAFDDIRTLIHEEFPAVIEDHLKKLETIEKKLATERRRKGFTNFYQKYIVRKNFVRGVTSMDEKTWSSVASDYFTFAYHYDHQIRLLADGKKTDIREMYRELLDISIGARRELTQNALSNITTAEIGYRDGVNLLNYRLGKEPLEETIAAIPKTLLNKVVTRVGQLSWYYLTRFKSDLQDLTQDYDQMHYFVTKTYDDRRLNEGRLREILGNFTTHSRKFLGARSNVLDEVFKKPLVKLEEKDEKWNKKIEELSKVLQEMKVNLKNLLERCKDIRESAWINSSVAVDHAREYLEDQSHGKTVLGQIITDSSLQEAVTKIDIFFREIRTRSQGLHDNYDRFLEVVLDIWDFIFDDPDALNYYKYKKFAWATMDLGELRESTITSYKAIRYDHDLIRMVKSRDHLFTSSMGKMMNLFKDYMAGNQLDANFYRQNFLQMDVFYRKLSYELIEQQQAYDVFGLLCDIGGSMGLFIGASALTIFELLDVFAYVIFRKAEPKPIRGSKFRNTR